MFALGDKGLLRSLVANAGFESVGIDALTYEHSFSDDDAVWSHVEEINPRLSAIVKAMEPGERAEMRRAVIEAYSPWRTVDGSYHLPGRSLAVLAR